MHTACRHGLANLTAELLQQGANPNLQTEEALPVSKETPVPMGSADGIYLQTPLHMAIAYNHPDVVSVILEQKGRWLGMMPIIISCGKQLFGQLISETVASICESYTASSAVITYSTVQSLFSLCGECLSSKKMNLP